MLPIVALTLAALCWIAKSDFASYFALLGVGEKLLRISGITQFHQIILGALSSGVIGFGIAKPEYGIIGRLAAAILLGGGLLGTALFYPEESRSTSFIARFMLVNVQLFMGLMIRNDLSFSQINELFNQLY